MKRAIFLERTLCCKTKIIDVAKQLLIALSRELIGRIYQVNINLA